MILNQVIIRKRTLNVDDLNQSLTKMLQEVGKLETNVCTAVLFTILQVYPRAI